MSLDSVLASLRPELADKARVHMDRCWKKGLALAITSGWRSPAEQMTLFRLGRQQTLDGLWHIADPSKVVTNAMPDRAPHCRGAAYDVVPLVKEKAAWDRLDLFQAIADCAQGLGLVWGGSWPKFKDLPHFELEGWRSLPLKEK